MSITPRPPPRTRRDVGRENGESAPWYDRVLARCVAGVQGASRWLRRHLVGTDAADGPGDRPDRTVSTTRTPARERAIEGASAPRSDENAADVVASLPAGTVPDEPELPPRPDLELEQSEEGLCLRRPGREHAYISSDEWSDVKR